MLTAGYLINRTPTQILDDKTPYEILFRKHPQFNLIKVFGCLCFAHRQSRDKNKFGEEAGNVFLLGIRLERMDGVFMILKIRNILYHVM